MPALVRRIALLGDMLEMGEAAESAHQEIAQLALDLGIELVGLAGPCFESIAPQLNRGSSQLLSAPDAETLAGLLADTLKADDLVLLKGSRGIAMERILRLLSGEKTA